MTKNVKKGKRSGKTKEVKVEENKIQQLVKSFMLFCVLKQKKPTQDDLDFFLAGLTSALVKYSPVKEGDIETILNDFTQELEKNITKYLD